MSKPRSLISLHLALFRTGIEKAEALDMKEQLVTDARRVLKEEKAWLFKQNIKLTIGSKALHVNQEALRSY